MMQKECDDAARRADAARDGLAGRVIQNIATSATAATATAQYLSVPFHAEVDCVGDTEAADEDEEISLLDDEDEIGGSYGNSQHAAVASATSTVSAAIGASTSTFSGASVNSPDAECDEVSNSGSDSADDNEEDAGEGDCGDDDDDAKTHIVRGELHTGDKQFVTAHICMQLMLRARDGDAAADLYTAHVRALPPACGCAAPRPRPDGDGDLRNCVLRLRADQPLVYEALECCSRAFVRVMQHAMDNVCGVRATAHVLEALLGFDSHVFDLYYALRVRRSAAECANDSSSGSDECSGSDDDDDSSSRGDGGSEFSYFYSHEAVFLRHALFGNGKASADRSGGDDGEGHVFAKFYPTRIASHELVLLMKPDVVEQCNTWLDDKLAHTWGHSTIKSWRQPQGVAFVHLDS